MRCESSPPTAVPSSLAKPDRCLGRHVSTTLQTMRGLPRREDSRAHSLILERVVGAHLQKQIRHLGLRLQQMDCCRTSDWPGGNQRRQRVCRQTKRTNLKATNLGRVQETNAGIPHKRPSQDLSWPTSSKPIESRALRQPQSPGLLRSLRVAKLQRSRRGYRYPVIPLLVR